MLENAPSVIKDVAGDLTRYKQAIGTTDTLNTTVTLEMADARKPRG